MLDRMWAREQRFMTLVLTRNLMQFGVAMDVENNRVLNFMIMTGCIIVYHSNSVVSS